MKFDLISLIRKIANYFDYQFLSWIYVAKVELANIQKQRSKSHNLEKPLIVSMTSYPQRFSNLHLTLKCLLVQSIAADQIVLWIAHADKPLLPEKVLNLVGDGLCIEFCDDIRSYKKIIPALELNSDAYIVTADDDVYYWRTWLEELLEATREYPRAIVAHRAHRIILDEDELPTAYSLWSWERNFDNRSSLHLNFATGCGGILYPPNSLFEKVTDRKMFLNLCPLADDIWLYWMARLNNTVVGKTKYNRKIRTWPRSQKHSLMSTNIGESQNDKQISSMQKVFPIFGDKHRNMEFL